MCRQVIEHHAHLVGLWIMGVDEFAHTLGEVASRAVLGDLDPAPTAMDIEEDEQIGRAVALIFAVIAFELPRRGWDRLTYLADELGWALVKAHHRPLWIGYLGVEIEHVLHVGNVGAVDLRDAPHVLAPRLEMVLGEAPTHRLAGQVLMLGELDHRAGQQLQGPARTALGWLRAGGRHQQRLFLAGELARRARTRLLAERGFQIAFDKTPLGPVYRRTGNGEAGRDRLVADTRIGCQQDLRPLQLARRVLATAQQRGQLLALALVQLDPVTYIHRCPPAVEGTTDESGTRPGSPLFRTRVHIQARAILSLYLCLSSGGRSAPGRSRFAAPIPCQPACRPPDDPHARARRAHPKTTGRRPQYRSARRPRRATDPAS